MSAAEKKKKEEGTLNSGQYKGTESPEGHAEDKDTVTEDTVINQLKTEKLTQQKQQSVCKAEEVRNRIKSIIFLTG